MRQEKIVTIATILFLTISPLLGPTQLIGAQENRPVTCYRDGSRVGTVTVFSWRAAAATCNTVLNDCRGACFGCFQDSNFVDEVCVAINGLVELKWEAMRQAKRVSEGVTVEATVSEVSKEF